MRNTDVRGLGTCPGLGIEPTTLRSKADALTLSQARATGAVCSKDILSPSWPRLLLPSDRTSCVEKEAPRAERRPGSG